MGSSKTENAAVIACDQTHTLGGATLTWINLVRQSYDWLLVVWITVSSVCLPPVKIRWLRHQSWLICIIHSITNLRFPFFELLWWKEEHGILQSHESQKERKKKDEQPKFLNFINIILRGASRIILFDFCYGISSLISTDVYESVPFFFIYAIFKRILLLQDNFFKFFFIRKKL